jgi:hypothetical protein
MLACLASSPVPLAAAILVALNVGASFVANMAPPQGLAWKMAHTILAFGPVDLIKVVQTWRTVEEELEK